MSSGVPTRLAGVLSDRFEGHKGATKDELIEHYLDGKDVLLCISHTLGCRYYLGEWKDEQFYPESHAQMSWADNLSFAPESLVDNRDR